MTKHLVSHRRAGAGPAERLVHERRAAGHGALLDPWDLGTGDSVSGRIETGSVPAGIMASTQARHRTGQDVLLVPTVPAGSRLLGVPDEVGGWPTSIEHHTVAR